MTQLERIDRLIELLKVAQEGSIRPDNGSGGTSSCNATGVVRDSKDAKEYMKAIWEKLSNELDFKQYIVSVTTLPRR